MGHDVYKGVRSAVLLLHLASICLIPLLWSALRVELKLAYLSWQCLWWILGETRTLYQYECVLQFTYKNTHNMYILDTGHPKL